MPRGVPQTRPQKPSDPAVGFALADLSGRPIRAYRAKTPFYAASTIKLGVLLAVGRAVTRGTAELAEDMPATRVFPGVQGDVELTGDHLDPDFPDVGTPLTLTALCEAMISRSSNEATNMLATRFGLPAVREALDVAGARDSRFERLIGDPAAVEIGLTNTTTPADLVTLMRTVIRPDPAGISAECRNLFLRALERQETAPIGRALPRGTRWGSKSGEVAGYRHDVAFIGDPDDPACRVLGVCTQGYDEDQADQIIAGLVHALVV